MAQRTLAAREQRKKNGPQGSVFLFTSGGEGGIRTRGGFYPSHAFQACDLNRSSTSPEPPSLTCIPGVLIGRRQWRPVLPCDRRILLLRKGGGNAG